MRTRWLLGITILALVLFGCQHYVKPSDSSQLFISDIKSQAKPWTEVGFLNDPNQFHFAIISDLHDGDRLWIFEEAVKKINLMKPEFVLSVGDLIQGYTEDEAVITSQRAEFERMIAPLGMRFFFVPGNHDLSNMLMIKKWEERYGRTYYHFIYRDVLFLCLNTEDPSGMRISDRQIEYVRKVLAENPKVRWTFVFMHEPLWLNKNRGWDPIEAMLADRPHTVFAGHMHAYVKYERHGNSYIRLGTTGGVSSLRGPSVGEFDQIAWVTMTDKGPLIANLALDGILDENLVTEEQSQMIERLYSWEWIKSEGIISEADYFKSCATTINLTNPESIPLKVRGTFKPNPQLTVSSQDLELIIPPKSTKTIQVEVKAKNPILLKDLAPLLLSVSAVYEIPGRTPIAAVSTLQVDLHYAWQGPELFYNGGFDNGLAGWNPSQRKPGVGTFSVESEALKAKVAVEDNLYSLVLVKIMNVLKAGVDYQLSLKAKNLKGPNQIRFAIRDGSAGAITNAQLVVDGKTVQRQTFELTESLSPYVLNFRLAKESDIKVAMLLFTFFNKGDVTIDDVSLRTINKDKMP